MFELTNIKTIASLVFTFIMLAYWTGAFVIMYHLIRFGVGNHPKRIAIIFLAGSLFLSIITTLFFARVIL